MTTWGPWAGFSAMGLALVMGSGSAWAQSGQTTQTAQAAAVSAEVRRSFAAYSFFAARLSMRHRALNYRDGSAAGPSGRSQAELHLGGQWRMGPQGPLSAWVQGSVIGRLGVDDSIELQDPLRSPMDDFGRQNLRLTSAFLSYAPTDDEGRNRWSVSAGRKSDLSPSGLLLYDGLQFKLQPKRWLGLSGYAGQRANLDSGFIDGRNDPSARLVAGLKTELVGGWGQASVGYRFEDVHVPYLAVQWESNSGFGLGGRLEGILGGRDAAQLDLDTRLAPSDLGAAVRASVEADLHLLAASAWFFGRAEVQLGTDPRGFGRGGRAARPEDVATALTVAPSAAALGRLFFGAATPHVLAELGWVQRLGGFLEFHTQGFLRVPLGAESTTGHRPQVLELWAGPSAYAASGARVSVDFRAAFQDPGEVQGLFTRAGDGERRRLGVEFNAELPWALSTWTLALRPQAAVYQVTTEGAGARAEGQLEAAGGASAVVVWDDSLWGALRYEGATTPSFGGTGVRAVHEIEVAIGGGW